MAASGDASVVQRRQKPKVTVPHTPGSLYECQNKRLTEFAFRKSLIPKDAISVATTHGVAEKEKRQQGLPLRHSFTCNDSNGKVRAGQGKSQFRIFPDWRKANSTARSIAARGDSIVLPWPTARRSGFRLRNFRALSAATSRFHENRAGKGKRSLNVPAATTPVWVVKASPAIREPSLRSR